MSPPKQPYTLFKISVKNCISIINSACYVIEKSYPENMFQECEREAFSLKCHLMSMLPVRLFDVLCSERTSCQYRGDPRVQLQVLMHPNMSVFRKCDLDNSIPQRFWIEALSNFNRLVVLDLKFICTDEILQVIGCSCPLLEEINIVSRVDICKSFFNASVLKRNVSDAGLCYIANLKQLRILAMDPPRSERLNRRIGRCVSQAGIIMLVNELPFLEELRIESCNIGSTLIDAAMDIGPLSLRKMNYHFASPEGIRKLMKICPFLKELSVVHFFDHSKDEILEQIALGDLRLNHLDLSFFSYGESMERLFVSKGSYLTHFSLWEMEHSVTLDAVLLIGKFCPNLDTFCLMTQSKNLVFPKFFRQPKKIFNKLHNLTIGCDNFDIDNMLTFFFECTDSLQKLVLKYQTKRNINNILISLLQKGCLKNIVCLWFDCTLDVSKTVVTQIIQMCDRLQMFTVDFSSDMGDVQKYIIENNLDLKLGSY